MPAPAAARSGVPLPMTLGLLFLLLSPRRGKALRTRMRGIMRSEGLSGFARRLQGPRA
jgi:hypothetical protein